MLDDDDRGPATDADAAPLEEASHEIDAAVPVADGSLDATPGNDASVPKRVFVTAQSTRGQLGGLDGGDALCNEEALKNGLPASFVAYLSVSSKHPGARVADAGTWALVDGTLAFDKPPVLGRPLVPLTQTAAGASVDGGTPAWTGHDPTSPNNRCQEWTTAANNVRAWAGTIGALNGSWQGGSYLPCDTLGRLYCFEQ